MTAVVPAQLTDHRIEIPQEGLDDLRTDSHTSWTIINRAHEALRVALAAVGEGDWQRPTPCAEWTVTQDSTAMSVAPPHSPPTAKPWTARSTTSSTGAGNADLLVGGKQPD